MPDNKDTQLIGSLAPSQEPVKNPTLIAPLPPVGPQSNPDAIRQYYLANIPQFRTFPLGGNLLGGVGSVTAGTTVSTTTTVAAADDDPYMHWVGEVVNDGGAFVINSPNTVTYTDNFNRPDNVTLGSNWVIEGAAVYHIKNNQAYAFNGGDFAIWNIGLAANESIQITVSGDDGSTAFPVIVIGLRSDMNPGVTGKILQAFFQLGTTSWALFDNVSEIASGSLGSVSAVGDTFLLTITAGNNISLYRNGIKVVSIHSDNVNPTGHAAMSFSTGVSVDNFIVTNSIADPAGIAGFILNDVIRYNGIEYICTANNPSPAVLPDTSGWTQYWQIVCAGTQDDIVNFQMDGYTIQDSDFSKIIIVNNTGQVV